MTQREVPHRAQILDPPALSGRLFHSENALKTIVKIITQNRVGKAERQTDQPGW